MPGLNATDETIRQNNLFQEACSSVTMRFSYINWKEEYRGLSKGKMIRAIKRNLAKEILSWAKD